MSRKNLKTNQQEVRLKDMLSLNNTTNKQNSDSNKNNLSTLNKSTFARTFNQDSKKDFKLYNTVAPGISQSFTEKNEINSFPSSNFEKSWTNDPKRLLEQNENKDDELLLDSFPQSKFAKKSVSPLYNSGSKLFRRERSHKAFLENDEERLTKLNRNEIDSESFGLLHFDKNIEVGELLFILEERFLKLEKRVETNESLIHLQDEMQSLKRTEINNNSFQQNNFIKEICIRLDTIENKLKYFEDNLSSFKVDVQFKMEEFTKKVEKYLDKFCDNISNLSNKIDLLPPPSLPILHIKKDENDKEDKIIIIDKKMDNLAEEVREKLKNLYDTVGDVGRLAEKSDTSMKECKENLEKLEKDFMKILNSCKEFSESSNDYKWLSEEIALLKYRQMQFLTLLNFNQQTDNDFINNDNNFTNNN